MDVSGWKLRLAALLIGLVGAGLLAELTVRLALPQPVTVMSPHLYDRVDTLRFRMAPETTGFVTNGTEFTTPVQIDAHGLRATSTTPPPDDAFRLLFVGDSFTFGWGVDDLETFSAHLGDALSTPERAVWAMNGGVPGYGPPDESLWFQRYGLPLEPDAVVFCFFVANDLADATPDRRAGSISYGMPEGSTLNTMRHWLFRRSQAYRFVRRAIPWSVREKLGIGQPWTHLYLRQMFESYAREPGEKATIGRRESRRAIAEIAAIAEARDLPIAAVLIPAAFQLDPELWNLMTGLLALDADELDPDEPARFFSETLAEHGVATLDLTPVIRERLAGPPPLYYQYDPHWTPDGHQLAAETMERFLLDLWPHFFGTESGPQNDALPNPEGDSEARLETDQV